ncbi:MAG: hypothetical protein UX09_C0044G0011, partial [Candidatus Uhrbacteria bacterium GW2011_GWE2_45_35]
EPLGKIDIWFRDQHVHKGTIIHKDIFYFLFSTPAKAELNPQIAEHVLEAKWLPANQLLKNSYYEDLIPVIKKALVAVQK